MIREYKDDTIIWKKRSGMWSTGTSVSAKLTGTGQHLSRWRHGLLKEHVHRVLPEACLPVRVGIHYRSDFLLEPGIDAFQ